MYMQPDLTFLPEQPEIVETEDFYWRVKLPNGKFLERNEGVVEDRTKFNTQFMANHMAWEWYCDELSRNWNPKVTRQQ